MKEVGYSWKSCSASIVIESPENRCGRTWHSKDFDKRRYRRGKNRCHQCGGYFSNLDWMIRAKKRSDRKLRKTLDKAML